MRGEKYTETSVSFHNRKVVYSLFFTIPPDVIWCLRVRKTS